MESTNKRCIFGQVKLCCMPFEINNPISKGILEVADKDFPNEMNWDDAMIACASLGDGWRLPSIEELEAMHEQLHMVDMGNFKTNNCYWSSSEEGFDVRDDDTDDVLMSAWIINFEEGETLICGSHSYGDAGKESECLVRAVRNKP